MRLCASSQLLNLILLVAFATVNSTETRGQLSVGSKWSRGRDSGSAVPVTPIRVSAPFVNRTGPVSVFGGVTVGRGFLPFYLPPYDPYCNSFYPGFFIPELQPFGVRSVFEQAYPGAWGPLGSRRYAVSYGYDQLAYPPLGQDLYGPSSDFQVPDREATNRAEAHEIPRVDLGPAFARPDSLTTFTRGTFESTAKPKHKAIDMEPLAGEFTPAAVAPHTDSPLNQIESLRLQTKGDQALRDGDFELARTYYQAAVQSMPDRKSAWLRMAWVHVFQHQHNQAASALNRALLIDRNPPSTWIDAHTLMGNSAGSHLRTSEGHLLTWLRDRPRSADRLLLTAAFQFFAGGEDSVTELLALAQTAGVSQERYDALVATLNLTDNVQPEVPQEIE